MTRTQPATHPSSAPKQRKPKRVQVTLSDDVQSIMRQLGKDASDTIGRTISGSAILRALLRHSNQQGAAWIAGQIFPFVERELETGVTWGRTVRKGGKQ